MPVQYQPYKSMYVSQRSPEISKMLRDRYMTNFAAQNELQTKLLELQAAPFEGDVQMKKDLDSQVSQSIQQFADRGDYENLSTSIMNLASQYKAKAAPIMQNNQLYNAYKENLKSLYEDDKIDFEDYQGALKLSTRNYSGVTKNEDGSYGNYFSGREVITNPDIPDKIKTALDGIAADEFGAESRVIGQGANGELAVETKEGIKTVSADKVNSVLDSVFMDPQVQMYLNRKGEIRTMDMSDDEIQNTVQALFPEQEISANPEDLRSGISQYMASKLENQYRQSAISKYSFVEQESSEKFYWDKWWLQRQNDSATNGGSQIGVPGSLRTESLGKSTSVINSELNNSKEILNDLQNPDFLHNELNLPEDIDFEDIMNMSIQDYTTKYGRDSAPLFSNARYMAMEAINTSMINTKLMNDAREANGFIPEAIGAKVMDSRYADSVSELSNQFGVDSNNTALILADLGREWSDRPASKDPAEAMASFQSKFPQGSKERDLVDYMLQDLLAGVEERSSLKGTLAYIGGIRSYRSSETILQGLNRLLGQELDSVDEFLENKTKRTMSVASYPVAPGMDYKDASKISDMISSTPTDVFTYIDPTTGKLGTLEDLIPSYQSLNEVSENFDITTAQFTGDVQYSPFSFGMHGGTMSAKIKDSEDNIVTVNIPLQSQVIIDKLQPYFSSAPYQLSRAISSFYSAGYEEARIPIQQPTGNKIYVVVDMESPQGRVYHVEDAQGNKISETGSLDSGLKDGYLSTLFEDGAKILPFE